MERMLNFDHSRRTRLGFDEAVLAEGKTREDILIILREVGSQQPLLVTRIKPEVVVWCEQQDPRLLNQYVYNARAQVLRSKEGIKNNDVTGFSVAIVTAGTSDRGVAEEAMEVLVFYHVPFQIFGDIGVAGLHRLLACAEDIKMHRCIICVAGMDGALASVVAGLFPLPVIGVPTSIGYGSSQKGTSALLSMLNSCSHGLCVMNIDNGFGAAMATLRLKNQLCSNNKESPTGLRPPNTQEGK